jgi:hypothetical protein
MIPVLDLLFGYVVAERMGAIILSAIVAHTAWHWMVDRWAVFSQFHIQMPEFNSLFVLTVLHWAMAIVGLAALLWGVQVVVQKFQPQAKPAGPPADGNRSSTPVA